MSPIQQMLLGAGGAVATKTYADDVFSTFLYKGTGSSQTISTGIDQSGEGALTWIKERSGTQDNILVDSVRGPTKRLVSNGTGGESTDNSVVSAFTSSGFTVGDSAKTNDNGETFCSWTFRKATGFFDVITYNGTGSNAPITVNHNLGSIPGFIALKRTDGSEDWIVWHRYMGSSSNANYLKLSSNAAMGTDGSSPPNASINSVSSTQLVIGKDNNKSGESYVVYIWAGGESTAATARSVDFDGATESLQLASNADLAPGTGDFTFECWLKPASWTSSAWEIIYHNGAVNGFTVGKDNSENFIVRASNNTSFIEQSSLPPIGQWTHVAVTRSGSTLRLFYNGVLKNSVSNSHNFVTAATGISATAPSSGEAYAGEISNLRFVKGTAVYTSSFRPPTEPLTNITNTKLLCCNNSSVTGSTVTPETITTNGSPTASTDSPFDDPAAHIFGESGSESVISTGSYVGNGNADGPEIFLGWEPSWLLIKRISGTEDWMLFDNMRTSTRTDMHLDDLRPNSSSSEGDGAGGDSNSFLNWTSTGFKLQSNTSHTNDADDTYIFCAVRRSDGYVGKPPELGTSVFSLDVADGSTDPSFISNFPVDFSFYKQPASSDSWYTGARLIGTKYLKTDSTDAEATSANFTWDYNDGWRTTGLSSSWQAWSWKRHAGFDVVSYKGDGASARQIPHSLSKIPEMMWVKGSGPDAANWYVYHKDIGNTRVLHLETTDSQSSESQARWDNTTPTSTHFSIGVNPNTNNNNYLAMLFASVPGVSAVGSYDGQTSDVTITTGFQPRFILIKGYNALANGRHWIVMDSVRGFNPSGNTDYLYLNSSSAQNGGGPEPYISGISSTGFTLLAGKGDTNARFEDGTYRQYIYYAHA